MSLTILQNSLVPSQDYQVKVRSLVIQRKDSMFRGIPSEWTDPVTWTSHGGTHLSAHTHKQNTEISPILLDYFVHLALNNMGQNWFVIIIKIITLTRTLFSVPWQEVRQCPLSSISPSVCLRPQSSSHSIAPFQLVKGPLLMFGFVCMFASDENYIFIYYCVSQCNDGRFFSSPAVQ